MGILAKLFGAVSQEEMNGVTLNVREPFWELEGKTDFPALFSNLLLLLPFDSTLYFEGGSPSDQLRDFLVQKAVPPRIHVAFGTIWPRPKTFHVPASAENLKELSQLMQTKADPELAVHFHAYCGDTIILEWHDAFTQPMLISNRIDSAAVQNFGRALGMKMKLIQPELQQE